MRDLSILVALVLTGLSGGLAQASPLMYVNDSANRLLTVDLSTGHAERLGTTDAQLTDIAFSPTGRLYGVTSTYVYEIDPADGSSTLLGPHGFGGPGQAGGIDSLTFTADGKLYAAGDNVLIRIDPVTGVGTRVGALSGYRSAGDLAVDLQGRLLLTTDAGTLVQVDCLNGGAAPIGSLPFQDIYACSGSLDGTLYGLRPNNQIVTINPQTGQSTAVGSVYGDFLLGKPWGASVPNQFIPECSTLLFFLCGAAMLMPRRSLPPA